MTRNLILSYFTENKHEKKMQVSIKMELLNSFGSSSNFINMPSTDLFTLTGDNAARDQASRSPFQVLSYITQVFP